MHWLDNYINYENLRDDELKYMHLHPLKMFAYRIKGETDYERVWGGVAIVQKMLGRRFFGDVFYVIDKTGLSKWQKFKIKFSYLFL